MPVYSIVTSRLYFCNFFPDEVDGGIKEKVEKPIVIEMTQYKALSVKVHSSKTSVGINVDDTVVSTTF